MLWSYTTAYLHKVTTLKTQTHALTLVNPRPFTIIPDVQFHTFFSPHEIKLRKKPK